MDLVAKQLVGLFFIYMDVNVKWKWKNPSFLVFLNTALRMSGFIPCFHEATMGFMRLALHPSHLLSDV